ncbi:hypothetical protein ACQKOE_10345 [Novosphingobium sp. NPDC080210]|uniref:hypothetical protein n=1 Tax=Novosphingobium sp. NPDC080210 TaxID=3390596 RepID=UPI003CFF9F65
MLGTVLMLLLTQAAPASASAVELPLAEPNPKQMSQKQIREFNSKVPRNHPFYIRCVESGEIGSLVKKTYSCRTNRQWKAADEIGNQNARDTYEEMTSKSWNTGN